MNKIDCMGIYNKVANDIKTDISNMGVTPTLNIYRGIDDYASNKYIQLKKITGDEVGINVNICDVKTSQPSWRYGSIAAAIENNINLFNGLYIAQLPMEKEDMDRMLEYGSYDVDYIMHPCDTISSIFYNSTYGIGLPATVKAIIAVINQEFPQGISGKKVAVVGCRSKTVGVYLHPLLTNMNATVITYHSKSIINDGEFEDCDIVISTVGSCGGIQQRHFGNKEGCVCIDVGVSKDKDNKTVGDFNIDIRDKQRYTPYINGIGLLTRIFLMQSVIFEFVISNIEYIGDDYEYKSSRRSLRDIYAQRKGFDSWNSFHRYIYSSREKICVDPVHDALAGPVSYT